MHLFLSISSKLCHQSASVCRSILGNIADFIQIIHMYIYMYVFILTYFFMVLGLNPGPYWYQLSPFPQPIILSILTHGETKTMRGKMSCPKPQNLSVNDCQMPTLFHPKACPLPALPWIMLRQARLRMGDCSSP
jgi:hypothetical protein